MAVITALCHREEQPHDVVNGGAREHRTIRRSGPVTGASMVGRYDRLQDFRNIP